MADIWKGLGRKEDAMTKDERREGGRESHQGGMADQALALL